MTTPLGRKEAPRRHRVDGLFGEPRCIEDDVGCQQPRRERRFHVGHRVGQTNPIARHEQTFEWGFGARSVLALSGGKRRKVVPNLKQLGLDLDPRRFGKVALELFEEDAPHGRLVLEGAR